MTGQKIRGAAADLQARAESSKQVALQWSGLEGKREVGASRQWLSHQPTTEQLARRLRREVVDGISGGAAGGAAGCCWEETPRCRDWAGRMCEAEWRWAIGRDSR